MSALPPVAGSLYTGPFPSGLPQTLAQELLQRHAQAAKKQPTPSLTGTAAMPTAASIYDQQSQRTKQAQADVTAQEQKMAGTGDFNPAQVQMQQQNPWAVVAQAVASLVSPRLAPAMQQETVQFQKLAADQYERDIERQQMEGQQYDRNAANQIKRLQALQGIAADAEKQQNETWKNAIAEDKNDIAWRTARQRDTEFDEKLRLGWAVADNNAKYHQGQLSATYKRIQATLIAQGMRDRTATRTAELRSSLMAAHYAVSDRVNLLRAQYARANAKDRTAVGVQLANAKAAQTRIETIEKSIDTETTKLATVGLDPSAKAAILARIKTLNGQKDTVERQVQSVLGPDFSLTPASDSVDSDATSIVQELDAAAGAEAPGYGAAAPNVTVNNNIATPPAPHVTVNNNSAKAAEAAPPQTPPAPTPHVAPHGARFSPDHKMYVYNGIVYDAQTGQELGRAK